MRSLSLAIVLAVSLASPVSAEPQSRGVTDAIVAVEHIDRARRTPGRVRSFVASDELARQLSALSIPRWPEGPLIAAEGTDDTAFLRYGADCSGSVCVHELHLWFVRTDGRMKLSQMSRYGW
jgi:hypothetical protein